MRKLGLATLLTFAFTSSGCFLFNTSPTADELNQQFGNAPPERLIANYDPLAGILPYPSNLVFSGTADGTINIPVASPDDYGDPQVVLNSLDGFSTMQPMTLSFSGIVDESTVIAGDTVRVFEVELFSFFLYATDVVRELDAPDALLGKVGEYTTSVFTAVNAGPDGEEGTVDDFVYDGISVNPTAPLKPETAYVVMVTNDIRSPDGSRAVHDLIYGVSKGNTPLLDENGHSILEEVEGATGSLGDEQAAALEPLRQINSSFENALHTATGVPTEKMVMTFGFTTQSISTMLEAVAASLQPGDVRIGPTIDATGTRVTTSLTLGTGEGDVFMGTLDVPYYLSPNSDPCHFETEGNDGTAACPAISDRWRGYQGNFPTRFYYLGGGYGPEQQGTETIPFFMTVPNETSGCTKPADGWPVNMFVHTMTQARWNMFAISDIVSKKCIAGFAMDLPLHGINKMASSAGQTGCEDAVDVLYAFSADAPASYQAKSCTCNVEDGEAVYTAGGDTGFLKSGTGLYQLMPWFNDVRDTVRERTLGVDRSANFPVEGAENGPDGIADSTGLHFFNPAAMLTLRDGMRQSVVDIMVATKSIPTITDTWTGTELGLQVQLSTAGLLPPSSGALSCSLVDDDDGNGIPNGEEDSNGDGTLNKDETNCTCAPVPGSVAPQCGPLLVTGLPALAIYDEANLFFPNGGLIGSVVTDLTAAGISAGAVISATELLGAAEIPTAGALYELSKALQVQNYVSQGYIATATPGACGTADAAAVLNVASILADPGALTATESGQWLFDSNDPAVAPVPAVTADDIIAALGNAGTASEALAAVAENTAAALTAASEEITNGAWTGYASSILANAQTLGPQLEGYVATFEGGAFVPDFRGGVASLGGGIDALAALGGITTVGCDAGEVACLGANTGNISAGTRSALLAAYITAMPAVEQAQSVMDLGEAGWQSLIADVATQLVDVDVGSQTVAGASAAVDGAMVTYDSAGADVDTALGAFLLGGCNDSTGAVVAMGNAGVAAGDLVTAIGNAAGSVSLFAAEVVDAENLVDPNTLIGPAYTLLTAAEGALGALLALSGATGDITTAFTAWDDGIPMFDASRISVTGHGVGAALGFVAATMEPGISQVAMAAPSGALAYAFEYSDTVRPLLVDGLKAAAGLDPDTPLWESFFAVLQTALDQVDPINFVDHLDDHQALLMVEIEDDDFFPAEVAKRPLAGSSVLAKQLGLNRIATSHDPDGDSPVRAVTRLNTDDSWGVHATFLAPYFGCVTNACGVAELDLACNAANEELRQEAWSQITSFIASEGRSVEVNTIGGGTGKPLVDVVP
jgi:hypothetical protein